LMNIWCWDDYFRWVSSWKNYFWWFFNADRGYICKVLAKCSYRQRIIIVIWITSCMSVTEFYFDQLQKIIWDKFIKD
jgi:hypothetical protein